MTKFYGLPILLGFIFSIIYPDFAVEYSHFALSGLCLLCLITSTSYKLSYNKHYSFGLLFSLIFSYLFLMVLMNLLCNLLMFSNSERISILLVICAPFALIAPIFTRKHHGDSQLSQNLIALSILISPIIYFAMLRIFDTKGLSAFSIVPTTKLMLLFTVLIFTSAFVSSFIPFFKTKKWLKYQGHTSSFIIAILVYIFWGQTWPLLSSKTINIKKIVSVSIIMLFLDFGIFYILKYMNKFTELEIAKSLRITLSMRNLAIPAILIATYSPSTLFIPAIGFISHILLFNFLAIKKNL
jgi:predicted Na+-dependent transporter